MTTTIAGADRRPCRRRTRRGMTIMELVVAMTLSAVAMVAIFSAFGFLARSSLLTIAYSDMDRQARSGLETFARDVRMAVNITTISSHAVILSVADSSPTGSHNVRYEYKPETKSFYRNPGTPGEKALITGIEAFVLKRFCMALGSDGQPLETSNDLEVKQLQIQLRAQRSGVGRATATNNVISARYVLRNKIVSG